MNHLSFLSMFLLIGSFLFFSFNLKNHKIEQKISQFKSITQMPYMCKRNQKIGDWGCGEQFFWDVVKEKEKAIPFLIERLDDTTSSQSNVLYFGGMWTIGDIAYSALNEIIKGIPTFDLMPVNLGDLDCGYCAYWYHLGENIQHRINFKTNVKNWVNLNKEKLVWVESNITQTCDCQFGHPNKGYFELKK